MAARREGGLPQVATKNAWVSSHERHLEEQLIARKLVGAAMIAVMAVVAAVLLLSGRSDDDR